MSPHSLQAVASGSGPSRPIRKLLVANRGEIAVRVFRTCRELGIAAVAVAPPDDAGSLHARSADELVEIKSYLDAAEHVRAAAAAGADAVHPGYGFLSESPEFAAAVDGAGIVWVGPPVEALRAGADKLASKRLAASAGIPVVPAGDPAEIGYPLLVKAAAGGGGRGMRVVRAQEELEEALAAARREAGAAFGDETVFCERYVERPRHVEIQLLADRYGTVLSLGERDCSVQRRHQKVLEESPSPALDSSLRARMSAAAVTFAREIGYVGAGTAEFMVAGSEFYFLELNARIQVEHPVTEAVTGIDLVAQQIRVAAGERLRSSEQLAPAGHAVEVRLYAEDPQNFLPQTGTVRRLRLPSSIRVDVGVAEGDAVGTRYDPMIAKLISHGSSRADALCRLREALDETEVRGVTTNLPFLRWLVAHPVFLRGEATTSFLEDHPPLSEPPLRSAPPVWLLPFRLNLREPARLPPPNIDDVQHQEAAGPGTSVVAPMPGTVLRVHVAAGQRVTARQAVVVLEAMKMETSLAAPRDGVVTAVHVQEGDSVTGGAVLVELAPGAP